MRSLKQLLLIAVLVTICSWVFWYLFFHGDSLSIPKNTHVRALVLEPHDCPEVPSQIMSELCGLSCDSQFAAPWELYITRLRAFPGIKSCSGSCHDSVGFITYTMRTPLFLLGGYDNVALDDEGVGFPLVPVFLPLDLPVLFPSVSTSDSFPCVNRVEVALAQQLQSLVQQVLSKTVQQIDLRFWNHPSPYRQEIILLVDGGMYLRLPVTSYGTVLTHLVKVLEKTKKPSLIVDGRFRDCFLVQDEIKLSSVQ